MSAAASRYQITIDDPKVFTGPWTSRCRSIAGSEPDRQLLDYQCVEFAEEFLYGSLRKQQVARPERLEFVPLVRQA